MLRNAINFWLAKARRLHRRRRRTINFAGRASGPTQNLSRPAHLGRDQAPRRHFEWPTISACASTRRARCRARTRPLVRPAQSGLVHGRDVRNWRRKGTPVSPLAKCLFLFQRSLERVAIVDHWGGTRTDKVERDHGRWTRNIIPNNSHCCRPDGVQLGAPTRMRARTSAWPFVELAVAVGALAMVSKHLVSRRIWSSFGAGCRGLLSLALKILIQLGARMFRARLKLFDLMTLITFARRWA